MRQSPDLLLHLLAAPVQAGKRQSAPLKPHCAQGIFVGIEQTPSGGFRGKRASETALDLPVELQQLG